LEEVAPISTTFTNFHQPPPVSTNLHFIGGVMKSTAVVIGFLALLAAPAAAQWLGTPTWNTPKGGTGLTIYGDYGAPNDSAGKGNAFGGRVAVGVGTITLTAGVASWKPENFNDRVTSYGGTAAFRLIGGSLIPVSLNLQFGAAHSAEVTSGTQTLSAQTTVTGAVGLSVPLPTPGFSIEPYFSPGIRYHKFSTVPTGVSDHQTNFGWVVGGNFGFGLVGIHLAYDSEKFDNGTHGIFGIGANVGIKLPLGM
jgi:hypothetical protein